jgi:hypothetical protein
MNRASELGNLLPCDLVEIQYQLTHSWRVLSAQSSFGSGWKNEHYSYDFDDWGLAVCAAPTSKRLAMAFGLECRLENRNSIKSCMFSLSWFEGSFGLQIRGATAHFFH